jgi:hypothetical protein
MSSGRNGAEPERPRQGQDSRWAPYLPYPNFLCIAPLDAILRILLRAPTWIPPAYWPRLAFVLLVSTLVTAGSLPERLLTWVWLKLRPPEIGPDRAPIFVLGYFRSGTTFLQNLLAADPALRSPLWAEVLAPQTFAVGWWIFRYLFVPFTKLARLDAVAPIGTGLPAEDEFAVNNWSGMSLMAGRALLPQRQAFYQRYHDLEGLSVRERTRWSAYHRAFLQKLTLISDRRRLVLKSPSHTARVRHLLRLYPGAKFVHISRWPADVFRSNVLLARELQRAFAFQPPLPQEEQEEMIAREYLETERRYLADRALIPPGDIAEVRFEDLSANPLGEVRRLYRELGLDFSPACEEQLRRVAASFGSRMPNVHPDLSESQQAKVARLQPLVAAFGHESSRRSEAIAGARR